MTRFIFLTDSHAGAVQGGYHQQACYAAHLPELLSLLDDWSIRHQVDFIIHGGDMVDHSSQAAIQAAYRDFQLSVPVYLCLGNHDLCDKNALAIWLHEAPAFFPNGSPTYAIQRNDVVIAVMPNHWCEMPFYWDEKVQMPHFSDDQFCMWRQMVRQAAGRPMILVTHSEVCGVPAAQTGCQQAYHTPNPDYVQSVNTMINGVDPLRCILSGHNHINTCCVLESTGCFTVTASAFTEVPFE
ncbi:MAG: metallophosphoesterase, partial [Anaerolineae bacterium]|nr:metallophosphoesterase [Anaerolineae bacterium]